MCRQNENIDIIQNEEFCCSADVSTIHKTNNRLIELNGDDTINLISEMVSFLLRSFYNLVDSFRF